MGFEYASRTHVGLKRKINEDAILVQPERGLWVVADGMGGHEAGEVASAMIVDNLSRVSTIGGLERMTARAVTALQDVNRELVRMARGDLMPRTIGSTVAALVMDDSTFHCFWAGDSRAYRIRDGGIEQLTRDHSLVQDLVNAGLLTSAEARDHPNASVITRAVGAADTLMVDRCSGDVRPGDQFLLATDGLTRVVEDAEICDTLSALPPGHAAESLLQAVLSRGAPDNVSLIIARPASRA